jgi:pilus assembly protein FimV
MSVSQLIARMGSMQDFERAGVIREYFLDDIQFSVELDQQGGGVIHLRTDNPLVEPYLNFVLDVRWPDGRILREYTALVDFMPLEAAAPVGNTAKADAPSPGSGGSESPETSYRVKGGDTLWDIALSVRPDRRYSPQQTMRAIVDGNPQAFRGGNINDLRAGAVLDLPVEEQIAAVDKNEARRWVQKQNTYWKNDDQAMAVPVVTADVSDEVEGANAQVAASEGAYLRLARADSAVSSVAVDGAQSLSATGDSEEQAGESDMAAEPVSQQLAVTLEDLDLAQRQNQELSQRLAALEEQVETMQRLMALKDKQLAQMQNSPVSSDAGLDKTTLLGVLGAALVAAFGGLLWSRRRGRQAVEAMPAPVFAMPERVDAPAESSPDESAESPAEIGVENSTEAVDLSPRQTEDASSTAPLEVSSLTPDEDLDMSAPAEPERVVEIDANPIEEVLNEVDVYLAYSRYAKALDLMSALYEEYPEDVRVQLKLLEAAAAADVGRDYHALLAELQASQDPEVKRGLAALFEEYPRLLNPAPAPAAIEETSEEMAPATEELEHLNWDIDTPTAEIEEDAAEQDALGEDDLDVQELAQAEGFEAIDFEMEVLDADLDAASLEDDLAGLDLDASGDDFEDFDLESLDELAKDITPLDDEALDLSALSLEDGEEVSLDDMMVQDFSNDDDALEEDRNDAMSSKLDMAKAYIEMGDNAQAKELLDEVERLGSEKQKDEATILKGSLS